MERLPLSAVLLGLTTGSLVGDLESEVAGAVCVCRIEGWGIALTLFSSVSETLLFHLATLSLGLTGPCVLFNCVEAAGSVFTRFILTKGSVKFALPLFSDQTVSVFPFQLLWMLQTM